MRMQQRVISFPPGLYKIVDEILVNAADVKARETEGGGAPRAKMNAIKVTVDQAQGFIKVWNDGEGKGLILGCLWFQGRPFSPCRTIGICYCRKPFLLLSLKSTGIIENEKLAVLTHMNIQIIYALYTCLYICKYCMRQGP